VIINVISFWAVGYIYNVWYNISFYLHYRRCYLSVRKKMLSVEFYRNLRRNLFYRIYFNEFHAICKGKFQKCDHWFGNTFTFCPDNPFAVHSNCAKKILHLREEFKHMTIVRIFVYLSLQYINVISFWAVGYIYNVWYNISFYLHYRRCYLSQFVSRNS
jgi:hypothetical protein